MTTDQNNSSRQENLEQEQDDWGDDRFWEQAKAAEENGSVAYTKVGSALVRRCIGPTAKLIEEFCEDAKRWNLEEIGDYLVRFNPRLAAFITAQACINTYREDQVSLKQVSHVIVRRLQDYADYMQFRTKAPETEAIFKRKSKEWKTYRERLVSFNRYKRWANVTTKTWPPELKLKLGTRLVRYFMDATGYITIPLEWKKGRRERPRVVRPTVKLAADLQTERRFNAIMAPPYQMPMIQPPQDWMTTRKGGYLRPPTDSWAMIKRGNPNLLKAIDDTRCGNIFEALYEAVNALQRTPWRINKRVYEVQRTLWEYGGGPEAALPLRLKKGEKSNESEKQKSKRIRQEKKLFLTEKFKDEAQIFFPHQLDWRGRAYPTATILNPQADESTRGLLEFAEGKPLGSSGLRWLKLNAANYYGEDKVSLDERVEWTDKNKKKIRKAAKDPIGNHWWRSKDVDKPYQFLAVCYEMADYWDLEDQGREDTFLSHFPCAVDGSCNGLQNLSAMLRDAEGGRAVNLVPSDKPHDLYSQVADLVWAKIEEEANNGNELAGLWKKVTKQKIRRKLAKRNVMTMPYSATQNGMANQLIETVEELRERNKIPEISKENQKNACRYLAKLNYGIIQEAVPGAAKVMKWMQKATRAACRRSELPIMWGTPSGFTVHQAYRMIEKDGNDVKCELSGQTYQFSLYKPSHKLNKKKMAQAIAPNFVHSMDANHLVATLLMCKEAGIDSFNMVHDSYGTHAGQMDTLNTLLRKAFYELYTNGKGIPPIATATPDRTILEGLKLAIQRGIPPKFRHEIPDPPKLGDLDLKGVLKSDYFFA